MCTRLFYSIFFPFSMLVQEHQFRCLYANDQNKMLLFFFIISTHRNSFIIRHNVNCMHTIHTQHCRFKLYKNQFAFNVHEWIQIFCVCQYRNTINIDWCHHIFFHSFSLSLCSIWKLLLISRANVIMTDFHFNEMNEIEFEKLWCSNATRYADAIIEPYIGVMHWIWRPGWQWCAAV